MAYKSFLLSLLFMLGLIVLAIANPQTVINASDSIRETIIADYGFVFTWSAGLILLLQLIICCTKYGSIKLCKPWDIHKPPAYSNLAYWSMILACGIGVAPIFWTVLEPVQHMAEGLSLQDNMMWVYHHWTLGAGSYYGLFALCIGYLMYNKLQTFDIRYLFKSSIANTLVCSSLAVAIAVSLALTFMYVLEIMSSFYSWSIPTWILFITAFTLGTAYTRIDKGLKYTSYCVIGVTLSLIGWVAHNFDYPFIERWINNWGVFLLNEPYMLMENGQTMSKQWLAQWSFNYFASWLSWAVFLGMFVAKISYGRTIRSMLIGAVVVPSVLSTLWFTVFGEAALLSTATNTFQLLSAVPHLELTTGAIAIMTVLFFVVQHDSAGLILEDLTVKNSRLLWVALIAILTYVLAILPSNSVELLRNITTITAVPILALLCYVFYLFVRNK